MGYGQNAQAPNYVNAEGKTPSGRWRFSAVNDMLLAIDLPGIDYDDSLSDSLEGQQALRILTDVVYFVQAEGWEFNTLKNYEVELDNLGGYTFKYEEGVPYVFSVVGQGNEQLFINQVGRVYKKGLTVNERYILGKPHEKLIFERVIIEDWASMPYSMVGYVTALAIRKFQGLMVGDAAKLRYTDEEIHHMYQELRREDGRSGKFNLIDGNPLRRQ